MNSSLIKQVIHHIQRSHRILIIPSAPIDGDSLGSAIAFYLMLKKLEKQVTAVCTEPIPPSYNFLPISKTFENEFLASQDFIVTLDCSEAEVDTIRYNVEQDKVNIIITPKKGQFSKQNVSFHHGPSKYDLIITVDTGDIEQLGSIYENHVEMFYNIPVINIDHHASNSEFGKINLVDITASATTEIIYELFKEMDPNRKFMDEDIATALLAGIITDTGSFQNPNTTPRALEIASELVTLGARQQEIIKYIYKTKDLTMLKLWGKILGRIKYDDKLKIVWSYVSQQDLKETRSTLDQASGILDNLMTNTPEAEIIILLKEKSPGLISGSIRTIHAAIDASKIAAIFGGGGHIQAAGFRYKVIDFKEGVDEVIKKISDFQKDRLQMYRKLEGEISSDVVPVAVPMQEIGTPTFSELPSISATVLEEATPISTNQDTKSQLTLGKVQAENVVNSKNQQTEELKISPLQPHGSIIVNDLLEKAIDAQMLQKDNDLSPNKMKKDTQEIVGSKEDIQKNGAGQSESITKE